MDLELLQWYEHIFQGFAVHEVENEALPQKNVMTLDFSEL
jgi:hypothetical protein